MHIRTLKGKMGTSYQCIVKFRGKTSTASFSTKAQAREWGIKRENEMLNEQFFPEKVNHQKTLTDAIERYKDRILPDLARNTQRTRTRALAFWESCLGNTPLKDIDAPLIDDCLYLLTQRGLKPNTVNIYRDTLSILFNLAASPQWNMTKNNPMKFVQKRLAGAERLPDLSV